MTVALNNILKHDLFHCSDLERKLEDYISTATFFKKSVITAAETADNKYICNLSCLIYIQEYKTYKENFLKRFQLTKLPPYLVFCIKRFTKNNFFVEKNPTIVNFPIT